MYSSSFEEGGTFQSPLFSSQATYGGSLIHQLLPRLEGVTSQPTMSPSQVMNTESFDDKPPVVEGLVSPSQSIILSSSQEAIYSGSIDNDQPPLMEEGDRSQSTLFSSRAMSGTFDEPLSLLEGPASQHTLSSSEAICSGSFDARPQSSQTPRVFSCSECTYAFTSQLLLQKHMKRSHNLYCPVFDEHPHVHADEKKPFYCKQCDKSFGMLSHLRTHQRLHTGEKPFQCKHCEKRFTEIGGLRRHQRVHTGEKPFRCEQCDKGFNDLGNMKRHQLIHTGEKPFHCKPCGKSFNSSSNLKKHRRLHTGEKPFHCQQCDKRFNELAHMKRHRCLRAGDKSL